MKIKIHNAETNEIIEREMNEEEKAFWQSVKDDKKKAQAEAEAKATQRQVLLSRLGITEEEARILLG
jgi:hypothetical protein